MAKYTEKEYVELFHLLFLDKFGAQIDKNLYALKGGCNLRFYLNSIRYSEDMDIDVEKIAKNTLQNKVRKCLASEPFRRILLAHGIEVNTTSEPEQTETAQKWKIGLTVQGIAQELRSKIEFSRRKLESGFKFEPVNSAIIQRYTLTPILVNHYPPEMAFRQKINALATRRETQARDVFDLFHLINLGTETRGASDLRDLVKIAQENALQIEFEHFKSQVLAFLPPDQQARYDSNEVWTDIVLRVTEVFEGICP